MTQSAKIIRTRRLRSGGVVSPDVVLSGEIPDDEALLRNTSNWSFDPSWSGGQGFISKVASAGFEGAEYPAATSLGQTYWIAARQPLDTTGGLRIRLTGPNLNPDTPLATRLPREHIARFTNLAAAHTGIEVFGPATYVGNIDAVQLVDMTAILAQPADIWIGAGQSLMSCERWSRPEGGNTLADYGWKAKRTLNYNQISVASLGLVAGDVTAGAAPFLTSEDGGANGVSPLYFFANAHEPSVASGRNLMVIQSAVEGSGLIGTDAEWNPAGSTGDGAVLYDRAVAQAQAALALNGSNTLKGVLWAQGEADLNASFGTAYPPAFSSMVSQFRTDLSISDLPFYIVGPPPDGANVNQALMISTQESLDENSGDANAITGVQFVARDSGWIEDDGIHSRIQGSKIVGERIAGIV